MCEQRRYSSLLSSKSSLINETLQVMSALVDGHSVDEVRDLVLRENLLLKQTMNTRQTIWDVLHVRYLSGRTSDEIHNIARVTGSSLPERARLLVLFYELARAVPLVYDLTVHCLYDLYEDGRSTVDKTDILSWLDQAQTRGHDEVGEWSPQTRGKVANNFLTIARDFGLMEGRRRKTFARVYVPLPAFVYVLYRLKEDGETTKGIVESEYFRLFLMDQRDVYLLLDEATHAGYVTFQRADNVYDLSFRRDSLDEVIDGFITQIP